MLPQVLPAQLIMNKQIYSIQSLCPAISGGYPHGAYPSSQQIYLQQHFISGRQEPHKLAAFSHGQNQLFFNRHSQHPLAQMCRPPQNQVIPRQSHVHQVLCEKCNISVELKDIHTHSQYECEFSLLPCKGCKKAILKKYLQQHENICELVELKCPECTQLFIRKDESQHGQIDCLKTGQRVLFDSQIQMLHANAEFKKDIDTLKCKGCSLSMEEIKWIRFLDLPLDEQDQKEIGLKAIGSFQRQIDSI